MGANVYRLWAKRKPHRVVWGCDLSNEIDRCSHPYRMRSATNGFSHGLKTVHRTVFASVCALVPPFRIPIRQKEKPHRMVWFFFLAEDEGFEPPQTESESGVLPLHKSSMLRTTSILYSLFLKCQALFSNSVFFLFGRDLRPSRFQYVPVFGDYAWGFRTTKLCAPRVRALPVTSAAPMVKMGS